MSAKGMGDGPRGDEGDQEEADAPEQEPDQQTILEGEETEGGFEEPEGSKEPEGKSDAPEGKSDDAPEGKSEETGAEANTTKRAGVQAEWPSERPAKLPRVNASLEVIDARLQRRLARYLASKTNKK